MEGSDLVFVVRFEIVLDVSWSIETMVIKETPKAITDGGRNIKVIRLNPLSITFFRLA